MVRGPKWLSPYLVVDHPLDPEGRRHDSHFKPATVLQVLDKLHFEHSSERHQFHYMLRLQKCSDSQVLAEAYQQQLISGVDNSLRNNRLYTFIKRIPVLGPFTFEQDLAASSIYRRARRYIKISPLEFCRSHRRMVHVFGYTSRKCSQPSVLTLPIYSEDLSNSRHYNYGDKVQRKLDEILNDEAICSRFISQRYVEIEMQLTQFPGFQEVLSISRENLTQASELLVLRGVFQQVCHSSCFT